MGSGTRTSAFSEMAAGGGGMLVSVLRPVAGVRRCLSYVCSAVARCGCVDEIAAAAGARMF